MVAEAPLAIYLRKYGTLCKGSLTEIKAANLEE